MDLKSLTRDRGEVNAGIWIKDIPNLDDIELKVRGLTSDEALLFKAEKERSAPRSDRLKDGNLKPEASFRIFSQMLAEVILIDWKGIEENGKPLKYSKEKARQIFADKNFLPFHDAVVWAAQVVDFGYDETKEELAGNSKESSSST